jgi:site-specific DNA recombinase
MKTPTAAAIYARISLDAEGDGKGVKRQVEDCRKAAANLGWVVATEFVDNDISAYSGKRRPEYERMLDDIRAGVVDGVLIYNLDRLTRRPGEFEHFNDLALTVGIPLRCVTGDLDIGTEDGLLMGRIQSAFAAKESAAKSRRQKRKNDEKAAAGLPHGGSQRPFGFTDDRITHRPDEAAVIRQLAERYLAGESLRSLATWLDAEGIRTVNGGRWRTHVVRSQLISPRTAGLKEHRGQIIGDAVWEPIISVATRERLLAAFDQRKSSGRRPPRRYLLSGLMRCALCGGLLYSARRETTRRYVCTSGPDHRGCGRITITAAPVEQLITETVLTRLDTPGLAQALAGQQHTGVDSAGLLEEITTDREQLDELATLLADRAMTTAEWMTARNVIEARIKRNERRLRQATDSHQLEDIIGQGDALRSQWTTLNLDRQAAIVRTLVDRVVIASGVQGVRGVDPGRIDAVWRL